MLFGIVALLANCAIWFIRVAKVVPTAPDSVFAVIFFASFLLPMVAAWRVSRWWLLLSLSPIVLWALEITHMC